MSAPPRTTSTPGEHRAAADGLRSPVDERRERDAPERLRRVEGRDDPDLAAVEARHEGAVGEGEQESGREERPRRIPGEGRRELPPRDDDVDDRGERRGEQGGGRRLQRCDVVVTRDPAHGVVARREERCAREREDDAEHAEAGRSPGIEREGGAAGDDERRPDEEDGPERLVEEREREQHRAERRGADEDRRA